MAKGFHAIRFKMVDFDGNWTRQTMVYAFSNVRYMAGANGAKLAVVVEAESGTLNTYRYQLAANEEVLIMDQVIHIPARCEDRDPGNSIKCG